MSFTLKDIEGVVIKDVTSADYGNPYQDGLSEGYNCALKRQSSVKLRFNREKLALTIFKHDTRTVYKPNEIDVDKLFEHIPSRDIYLSMADAIIAAEKELIEVEK